jgi:hypothetical protein
MQIDAIRNHDRPGGYIEGVHFSTDYFQQTYSERTGNAMGRPRSIEPRWTFDIMPEHVEVLDPNDPEVLALRSEFSDYIRRTASDSSEALSVAAMSYLPPILSRFGTDSVGNVIGSNSIVNINFDEVPANFPRFSMDSDGKLVELHDGMKFLVTRLDFSHKSGVNDAVSVKWLDSQGIPHNLVDPTKPKIGNTDSTVNPKYTVALDEVYARSGVTISGSGLGKPPDAGQMLSIIRSNVPGASSDTLQALDRLRAPGGYSEDTLIAAAVAVGGDSGLIEWARSSVYTYENMLDMMAVGATFSPQEFQSARQAVSQARSVFAASEGHIRPVSTSTLHASLRNAPLNSAGIPFKVHYRSREGIDRRAVAEALLRRSGVVGMPGDPRHDIPVSYVGVSGALDDLKQADVFSPEDSKKISSLMSDILKLQYTK